MILGPALTGLQSIRRHSGVTTEEIGGHRSRIQLFIDFGDESGLGHVAFLKAGTVRADAVKVRDRDSQPGLGK